MDDDGDDRSDTKRKNRNLGEKKRRDQFNCLVNELSNLISNPNRKMDKSTVLKSTISFLKNHNEVTVRSRAHDVQEDWKPEFLSNEEFTYLVMEALEGFIMVFSTNGCIHYVSENINSLLGYNPEDVVDKNIFELMHEDDQQRLFNLLQKNATEHIENQSKENEMIRFQVHVRQGGLDFREEGSYDVVQFYGHFRTNQEPDSERDAPDLKDNPSSSRVLFVCIGCLCTPKLIRDASLVDYTRSEFASRHSLEWKFLFLDHRAPPIIGYLPFEVLGTSGYDYYHFDDLEKIVSCHKALIQKGELTSCYYRFLTKGQQWIWLQTRYYITYHQWSSRPEFVVCTHRVVSYAEVTKLKEELDEQDTELSESDNTATMKEMPVKDSTPPPYDISKANNDAYAKAYRSHSENKQKQDSSSYKICPYYLRARKRRTIKLPTAPECKDTFKACVKCRDLPQLNTPEPQVTRPPSPLAPQSMAPRPLAPQLLEFQAMAPEPGHEQTWPSLSDLVENYLAPFDPPLKPVPVKDALASTADTVSTGDSWDRPLKRYTCDSDASMSEESQSSQRNSEQEVCTIPPQPQPLQPTKRECMIAPQHGMGTQYLDPPPYVADAVPPCLLSVNATQPLGPQDQAQIQMPWQQLHRKHEEQLNRKHVELQTMIERQLEELREVKEQLMLARLGIMQPLTDVPENAYSQEELQNQEPHYSDVGTLQQMEFPDIPPPPHQPHPDHQNMPQ